MESINSFITSGSVVFTGNIIRFNPAYPARSNQLQNIRWLQALIESHLKLLGVRQTRLVAWSGEGRGAQNDIYGHLQLQYSLQNYLAIYHGDYNERLNELLLHAYSGALVIGFELPPFLVSFFDQHHIPYIDVILGPIRFFPDLVPALRTNHPEIQEKLAVETLPEELIRIVSGWRKAFFCKRKLPFYAENTIVLMGQVSLDTSQILNRQFVSLEQFEESIVDLQRTHELLFKPHPYALQKDVELQMRLMQKLKIRTCHNNAYELLCSEGVCGVAAVSSSVLIEAPYFDRQAYPFIAYPFPFSSALDSKGLGYFHHLYGKLDKTGFWARILGYESEWSQAFGLPEGALAESLGQSWGASVFGTGAASTDKRTRWKSFLGRMMGL